MSQQAPIKTALSRDVVSAMCEVIEGEYGDCPLLADLRARAEVGKKTYGTRLMSHNGRDALQDAHEEILDALAYIWQARMEYSDQKRSMWLGMMWRDLAAIERQIRCLRALR